ncbi:PEP-CTERM sorting domain-containing protein [Eleftheria terrae]|uniref:PEP-CTERM sorting domain-containing protein n=1 Tax=Eleftheria terrae TaxID=1597781 RepID=UPI00263A44B2|nr:PEP-CTERM sorting domain-containing protein [Eleftheria terrae]WKB55337.1 PEP-CTERM sorting domain-containing protein [Eleftheria terrae]
MVDRWFKKVAHVSCLALLLAAASASAAPRYRLVNIDNSQAQFSSANGVSPDGKVAGYIEQTPQDRDRGGQAFVRDAGSLRTLGRMDGLSAAARINSDGHVVGVTAASHLADTRPFWYDGAQLRDFGGAWGVASDINEKSQIVGGLSPEEGGHRTAFLHDENGTTLLGTLAGAPGIEGVQSIATSINEAGQIAGSSSIAAGGPTHAFRYENGSMHDLGTLGLDSTANGINAGGQVVGSSFVSTYVEHAFLHDGSSMHDLGTLGGANSAAHAINASGLVVGTSAVLDPPNWLTGYHAFLFENGEMLDLNALVDGSAQGWTLVAAHDINDRGEIVGRGYFNNGYHGFLLQPVPEPGTVALMGVGLLAIAVASRRGVRRSTSGGPALAS